MLYLVYVLTFLAGILFYVLSPRDDQVNLDAYKAEGFIVTFLAQHQAAKDYMAHWLGFDLKNTGTEVLQLKNNNNRFQAFAPRASIGDLDVSSHQSADITMVATEENPGDEDFRFLTNVFCLQNDTTPTACNGPDFRNAYLVTYSAGRPSWWPRKVDPDTGEVITSNRQMRLRSWVNAISRRTGGSYNCGLLVNVGAGEWCVDNGEMVKLPGKNVCAQKVPKAIVDAIGGETDAFICISRVKQGPNSYYVSGLTAFYDGINNKANGADANDPRYNGASGPWKDMMENKADATGTTFPNMNDLASTKQQLAAEGVTFPNFNIAPGLNFFRDFTYTVLLKGVPTDNLDTTFLGDGSGYVKFKLHYDVGDEDSYVYITVQSDPSDAPVPLKIGSDFPLTANSQIVSLTVIGRASDQTVSVYVNAYHDPILILTKSDWDAWWVPLDNDAKNSILANITYNTDLKIENAYVYGICYYDGKVLTVKGISTPKKLTLSELEQNFNVDAKRYGIRTGYVDPSSNKQKKLQPEYD